MDNILDKIIRGRRTVKPDRFTGAQIPDEAIWQMLNAAHWAPTHGHTEPWRFHVFKDASKEVLLQFLNTLDAKLNGENEVRAAKRKRNFLQSSHIIAIGARCGTNPKIPEIEDVLATAMAVQNIWLTAHNLGFGGYWSTGVSAYHQEFASFLGLNQPKDQAMGLFYLGVPVPGIPDGHRISAIEEKVTWHS